MTALRWFCGTLLDIDYDSPKKVLWNTRTSLMTVLRRFCGTLKDISYDSPKKALWNTMGHNL